MTKTHLKFILNEFCISKLKYKSISVLKLAIVTLVFSTNNLIQL